MLSPEFIRYNVKSGPIINLKVIPNRIILKACIKLIKAKLFKDFIKYFFSKTKYIGTKNIILKTKSNNVSILKCEVNNSTTLMIKHII